MIICHNFLEYAEDRPDIVKEFARILKKNGKISIVKHNRAGRVMQMVVLLNDFEHAHSLLDGNDGMASKYGAIRYYEDKYKDKVNKIAMHTSDRKHYAHLVSLLRKMQQMKGGVKFVEQIAAEWKVKYKNRPAMMDELRKL